MEQRTQIARDLNKEDGELRHYIETGNLDFWFKELLSSAEMIVAPPVISDGDREVSATPLPNTPEISNKKATLSWL